MSATATTRPPPPDEIYDERLLELLAMIRPHVWRGPIEDERPASATAETMRPDET